jgi:hypothetical protein
MRIRSDEWAVVRRYMTIEQRQEPPKQRALASKRSAAASHPG